ncbi:unnamed protein product, partial [marine sediment metagenome]
DKGIYIYSSSDNNNIINCDSYNNTNCGINIRGPSNNIIDCDVYNNTNQGIFIYKASDNTLIGNDIYNNVHDFSVSGSEIDHYTQYIDPTNTINGKRIYYIVKQSGITLDENNNFGYLALISCTNIIAKNSDVYGMLLINTTDSTISNVDSHNSGTGIYIWMASNNNIMD